MAGLLVSKTLTEAEPVVRPLAVRLSAGPKAIPLAQSPSPVTPAPARYTTPVIPPAATSQATAVVTGPKAIPLSQPLQVGTPAATGDPTPPGTGIMLSSTALPIAPAAPLTAAVSAQAPQIITTQPIIDPSKQIPLATTPRPATLIANSGNDASQASSVEIDLPRAPFTTLDGLVIVSLIAFAAVFVFKRFGS